MKCSSCGRDLLSQAKFCHYCGEAVKEPLAKGPVCPQCGAEGMPDDLFCAACKTALTITPPGAKNKPENGLSNEERPPAPLIPKTPEKQRDTFALRREDVPSKSRNNREDIPSKSRNNTAEKVKEPLWAKAPPIEATTPSAPGAAKESSPAPPRRKGLLLKGMAALGLAAVFLVQCLPGMLENPPWAPKPLTTPGLVSPQVDSTPEVSFYGSVILSDEELATPGEAAQVSPEDPVAEVNGARIDFGAYALEKPSTLKVARLPQRLDAETGTAFEIYTFNLDDAEGSEFPVLVDITLPYDGDGIPEAEEADRISIAYYDKIRKVWQAYPATVDTKQDLVTFSTLHFSAYGVLRDARGGYAQTDLIKLFVPLKKELGPASPVFTTSNRIDEVVQALDQATIRPFISEPKIVSNPTHRFWFSVTADSINGMGTLADPPYIDDFIKKKPFELHGKVLGGLGILLTVSKVGYQLKSRDEPQSVLWDNMVNLCEASATGLAIYYSSPVWGSIATGFWIWGLSDYAQYLDAKKPVAAAESHEEEFYRIFTAANMVWLHDSRKWVYFREQFDKKYKDYEPDYAKEQVSHGIPNTWAKIFRQIEDEYRFDPKGMAKTIDAIINQYCDAFWDVDGSEVLAHAAKFETGILFKGKLEEFNWPDNAASAAWHQRFKAQLIHDLGPLFQEMSRTAYEELRKEVLRQVLAAWPVLNELTTVAIEDPAAPSGYFPSSAYASNILRFEPLKAGTKVLDWTAKPSVSEGSNTVFSYNLYHYLEAGAPTRLAFYKDAKQIKAKKPDLTLEFSYNAPQVTLRLPEQDHSGYYAGDVRFSYSDGIPRQESNYWIRSEQKGNTVYIVPCKDNGDYAKDLVMACHWDEKEKAWIGKKSGSKAGETVVYAVSFQKIEGKEAVIGKIMVRDPDEQDGSWEDHNADYEFAAVKVHPLSWHKE